MAWLESRLPASGVTLADRTLDTAMIAVQGPRAIEIVAGLCPTADAPRIAALKNYTATTATVAGTPAWARAGTRSPPSAFAADPADYGAFVGRIAGRYRGRVAAWELGNEPNHTKSFAVPDARRYLGFLRAGYRAIKAADPQAIVATGGIGGTRDARGDIPGDEFVAQLYALGAQRWFDVLSYHPVVAPRRSRGRVGAHHP